LTNDLKAILQKSNTLLQAANMVEKLMKDWKMEDFSETYFLLVRFGTPCFIIVPSVTELNTATRA